MTSGEITEAESGGESSAAVDAAARPRDRSLTPREAAVALDHRTVAVDVREPAERVATGRIPGAVIVPPGMLERWADPASWSQHRDLDPARPTLVYCATGDRSALAADALRKLGYRDVAHLAGGFEAWQNCGFPVEP